MIPVVTGATLVLHHLGASTVVDAVGAGTVQLRATVAVEAGVLPTAPRSGQKLFIGYHLRHLSRTYPYPCPNSATVRTGRGRTRTVTGSYPMCVSSPFMLLLRGTEACLSSSLPPLFLSVRTHLCHLRGIVRHHVDPPLRRHTDLLSNNARVLPMRVRLARSRGSSRSGRPARAPSSDSSLVTMTRTVHLIRRSTLVPLAPVRTRQSCRRLD